MLGCPLSDLPDYTKIVKKRLPESCILDNEDESDDENENRAMQEKLLNSEDANFIKELVADGLLVGSHSYINLTRFGNQRYKLIL